MSKRRVRVKPCKKCGSKDITFWDCSYSSFNPGGGKCNDCGRKCHDEVGCLPTRDTLVRVWNRGQLLTSEEKLRNENKRLRKKVRDLQREIEVLRGGQGES